MDIKVEYKDVPNLANIMKLDDNLLERFTEFVDAILDFRTPDKFLLKQQGEDRNRNMYNLFSKCLQLWIGHSGNRATVTALDAVLGNMDTGMAVVRSEIYNWAVGQVGRGNHWGLVEIEAGDTGVTYQSLVEKLPNIYKSKESLTMVDTYVLDDFQINNFREFVQTMVDMFPNVLNINLRTLNQTRGQRAQIDNLRTAINDLNTRFQNKNGTNILVQLDLEDDKANIHDRYLSVGSEKVAVFGRGLDIYKDSDPDFSQRKCREFNFAYKNV